MIVEINDFPTKPIFNISIGEMFIFSGELFMRVGEESGESTTCVNLRTGKLTEFFLDLVVKYVPNERIKVVVE